MFRKSPCVTGCLCPHLPETLWRAGQEGGLAVGAAAACSSPSIHPKCPGSGTTERHLPIGPLRLTYPGPTIPLTMGWMRLICPGPQGPAWVGSAMSRAGLGQPSLSQTGQCPPPHWLSRPTAHVLSVPPSRAPSRPPHAPSCQSRCRVWCCALSPWGWVGALPPVYSLPGAFLCRFLNVILKSGK